MKKLLSSSLWLLILAGLIVGGVVVYQKYFPQLFQQKTVSSAMPVTTAKYRDIVQNITLVGSVVSNRQTVIQAPYKGYIKKLYVKVGEKVDVGTPIVSVSPSLHGEEKVYPIRAPYAGVVVSINKSEGQYVTESSNESDYIVKIDDLSQMYVDVDIPEFDITKVKKGQKVTFKATAILDHIYHGVIENISLASKPDPRSAFGKTNTLYPAKIKILDQDKRLLVDMSVIVDITISKAERVLSLPHEYIHKEGSTYYVVLANGKHQPITLGVQNARYAQIVSGLTDKEKVRQVDYLESEQ